MTFGGLPGSQRAKVLARLLDWRSEVSAKGLAGRLILNGSFISQKQDPGDFDCIFVYDQASADTLRVDDEAQTLISYSLCKARWLGDIFAFAETTVQRFPNMCSLDMFDYHKETGESKGVLEVSI